MRSKWQCRTWQQEVLWCPCTPKNFYLGQLTRLERIQKKSTHEEKNRITMKSSFTAKPTCLKEVADSQTIPQCHTAPLSMTFFYALVCLLLSMFSQEDNGNLHDISAYQNERQKIPSASNENINPKEKIDSKNTKDSMSLFKESFCDSSCNPRCPKRSDSS